MKTATTVTWQSWSEKWGHWNIWQRPNSNSVRVLTFDDLLQRQLVAGEPSAIDRSYGQNPNLDSISAAAASLPAAH